MCSRRALYTTYNVMVSVINFIKIDNKILNQWHAGNYRFLSAGELSQIFEHSITVGNGL
jgi:hypothetical protein